MIPQHPADIANEIRMLRPQHRDSSFLVVEGHDDSRFMWKFISRESCEIIVAYGKQNVFDAINILEADDFIGVLGMVDADFDRVERLINSSLNVVMPESHDLDAMLIYSPAFDLVMDEFASVGKLNDFGKDVLQTLMDRALQLAYLRLYSLRNDIGLRFRGMNQSAWIDVGSFDSDADRLIETVKNRSQRQYLLSDEFRSEMDTIESSNYDPREMCNGTDMIGILSVGLRRVLGTNNATSVNTENLRRSLRLAYSEQHFMMSNLYKDIRAWESRIAVFKVLRL